MLLPSCLMNEAIAEISPRERVAGRPILVASAPSRPSNFPVRDTAEMTTPSETIDDKEKNLHLLLYRQYLSHEDTQRWWETICEHVLWRRVKYKSGRFGKDCETPCYTAFYGGFPQFAPYEPVPIWLTPLVDQVSALLGVPFNALLLRLYFDGKDEIAWHTDGRTFLGATPTIGSLSLGATATFEMRRMRNVWPELGQSKDGGSYDDGIDHSTPPRAFALADGDLIVMLGDTQAHWHHRVPKARSRRPRININFRYILPDTQDSERGQATYYKYMRDGDAAEAGMTYEALTRKVGSLLGFVSSSAKADVPTVAPQAAAPSHEDSELLPLALVSAESEWSCPQCTLLNPPMAPVCAVCEYLVPGEGAARSDQQSTSFASQSSTSSSAAAAAAAAAQPPPAKRARAAGKGTLISMWAKAGPT